MATRIQNAGIGRACHRLRRSSSGRAMLRGDDSKVAAARASSRSSAPASPCCRRSALSGSKDSRFLFSPWKGARLGRAEAARVERNPNHGARAEVRRRRSRAAWRWSFVRLSERGFVGRGFVGRGGASGLFDRTLHRDARRGTKRSLRSRGGRQVRLLDEQVRRPGDGGPAPRRRAEDDRVGARRTLRRRRERHRRLLDELRRPGRGDGGAPRRRRGEDDRFGAALPLRDRGRCDPRVLDEQRIRSRAASSTER